MGQPLKFILKKRAGSFALIEASRVWAYKHGKRIQGRVLDDQNGLLVSYRSLAHALKHSLFQAPPRTRPRTAPISECSRRLPVGQNLVVRREIAPRRF